MAKKTGKKTGKLDLFPIINGIIMVLFIVITLYPVLNTLAISLNDGTDALRGGIYLLPRKFTWKNYITVLQKDNLITGAYITVARTIIGTLLALVANAILAFIVSRKRFLFKKELSLFWVITMYVNGGMIPTVQTTWPDKQFRGICNSWNGQCVQYAGNPYLYERNFRQSGRVRAA